MSLTKYVLSELAEQDLIEINDYGLYEFGFYAADKYKIGIIKTLNMLFSYPRMGRLDDTHKSLHVFPFKNHQIYYLIEHTHIYIVRIIHGKRNPTTSITK